MLRLPVSSAEQQAAFDYACHLLAQLPDLPRKELVAQVRRISLQAAGRLVIQHHLQAQGIPFRQQALAPLSDPQQRDLVLGGRRCVLVIEGARASQQAPASSEAWRTTLARPLPLEQLAAGPANLVATDIYLFGCLYPASAGSPAPSPNDLSISARFFYPLPAGWRMPRTWKSHAPLKLHSMADQPLTLTAGGLLPRRGFFAEQVALPPTGTGALASPFHALLYLGCDRMPAGKIELSSQATGKRLTVMPRQWAKFEFLAGELHFLGYLTHGEIQAHLAIRQPTQASHPPKPLTYRELVPILPLLENAKQWSSG